VVDGGRGVSHGEREEGEAPDRDEASIAAAVVR
jgi:hypothetical protein